MRSIGIEPAHQNSFDDEIDEPFLKAFKMFKSDYYEGNQIVVVVNGFCERAVEV